MDASPKQPKVRLPRLYAILDVDAVTRHGRQPLDVADAWLAAGVRLIQLRGKGLSLGAMLALAEPIALHCRRADAVFVVNDRADVARLIGADGVHVGQQDLTPSEVRESYPGVRVIGYSTHSLDQVTAGLAAPATYLAFGPIFETRSKAAPDPVVGLDGLRSAVALAMRTHARPVVAIGGITLDTAASALGAGASSVAVISDLLVGDPGRRARAWLDALA